MTQLLDPALAETRVMFGIAEAEFEQHSQWRASAAVFRAIDDVMREAALHPDVFVDEQMLRGDAVEMAVRAAVADLAVRLNLAEGTVRSHGHIASTLRQRMPLLWQHFCEGEVSTQNAREAAAVVMELPAECWADFDEQLVQPARTMTSPRFRAKAHALREKLHARPLAERRESAMRQRRIWSEPDRDGMGWLHALLPLEEIARATAHIDALAFEHFACDDESRTMGQLRADVFADLLAGAGTASAPRISVVLTIPMMSMLGLSDDPALLEGVGPIDLDTARKMAGDAPSITRLLTDPATGAALRLDPTQYRTSAALRRWIRTRHATCDFPGCGRRAINCDLDHTESWASGGLTTADNLAPRCRRHHVMKHQSRWKVDQPPGAPRATWTSPTGHEREADPPPF